MTVNNNLLNLSIITAGAACGTLLAFGSRINDWRWVSILSSIGCVLSVSYIDLGKPFIYRLL